MTRVRLRAPRGSTVREALTRAGIDPVALREGRVFKGKKRVTGEDERLTPGEDIEVAPPSPAAVAPVRILLHEGDLVAVEKPAGIPTIPDLAGSVHSLQARVAEGLALDPGRLHPTSRLDRGVSGVVFFALTRAAGERLARARAAGAYERRYVAIASRAPAVSRGTWDGPIGRASEPRLRAIGGRDAVPAVTNYAIAATCSLGHAVLGVAPVTGRTHQIRLHAAHAGLPLVGDHDYRGPSRIVLPTGRVLELGRVALHAARAVVPDEAGRLLVARAPVPLELEALWSALGGEPSAWEVAASCALG